MIFTDAETEILTKRLLANAEEGMEEGDMIAAFQQLERMRVEGVLVEGVLNGHFDIVFDSHEVKWMTRKS